MSARVSEEEKKRKARIRSHRWYHAHKHEIGDAVRERTRRYYQKNKHKIKMSHVQWKHKLEWQKAWRSKNRDKLQKYAIKERENMQRVIKQRLCSRITGVLRRRKNRKNGRTIELIGCTWIFLKRHLESQFMDGMSWANRHLWHIDHERPCASFDLTDREQQLACFHYSNLRPLWSHENMKKGAKWNKAA
jgi:Prasinovirus endonuclease VII